MEDQYRVQKPSASSAVTTNGSSNGLNPRSCVTCRKRKVKCDKKQPCTNCTRQHIECVYPSPGRAPRKPRKPADGELIERLRKLEGVVKSLGLQVEEEQALAEEANRKLETTASRPNPEQCSLALEKAKDIERREEFRRKTKEDTHVNGLETRFGRLVVDEGRSRYINNSYWASLSNEVEDLKGILNDSTDEEQDHSSPDSVFSQNSQGYIFSFSSSNIDMLSLHPPPAMIPKYWDIYKDNVDTLVKILHIPTMEPKILNAAVNLDSIPKGMEALMFAIYYGVATSLQPEDCLRELGEDRNSLLLKYKFALEQALARANFLVTDEMIVLQAFVIFLILLRRNADARVIWTLTGLVVRIAQTLGIHRDGSHFDLSPFEIEMRRRLWWQVCVLDSRASEDHGCDPTIVEALFDTKLPLNVNDTDIYPEMKDFPPSRTGCTDMTFCLIRFEVANTYRRIQYVPPGPVRCSEFLSEIPLEKKEEWIRECHTRVEEKYLKDCDMSIPMYWVIATVSRLIMSKMWLMVYHPFQRLDGGASLPQETKDRLFVTSLENVEYSLLLETERRTMKWGWLVRTYVQWHAIAFLLTELCVRTRGPLVARAWRAIETVSARQLEGQDPEKKRARCSGLWRPLRILVRKARAARANALKEQLAATRGGARTPWGHKVPGVGAMDGPTFSARTAPSARMEGVEGLEMGGSRLCQLYRQAEQRASEAQTQQRGKQGVDGCGGGGEDVRMHADIPLRDLYDLAANPDNAYAYAQGYADWFNALDPFAGLVMSPTINESIKGNGNGGGGGVLDPGDSSAGSGSAETSPLQMCAVEDVNWASWDDMVMEFGMDVGVEPGDVGGGGGSLKGGVGDHPSRPADLSLHTRLGIQ
ncbi:hypothetical protein M501DRAFT_1010158 [Patellaria atrata CBS 101060]|uniref:Zn(2)-C6 fungal-type domain-containing protein n=1 Tax=Patellaria atrata CBS 101060 TaxID=1346257 RepID=A0A9P4SFS7_9PEZI|nr:hypothetical protein M501DRAFT_1010158 [Patellaria atrata CBS 101060]